MFDMQVILLARKDDAVRELCSGISHPFKFSDNNGSLKHSPCHRKRKHSVSVQDELMGVRSSTEQYPCPDLLKATDIVSNNLNVYFMST